MLVFEGEGVSLRRNGDSQQEQDEYNPPAPARPSCHAYYDTKYPRPVTCSFESFTNHFNHFRVSEPVSKILDCYTGIGGDQCNPQSFGSQG